MGALLWCEEIVPDLYPEVEYSESSASWPEAVLLLADLDELTRGWS